MVVVLITAESLVVVLRGLRGGMYVLGAMRVALRNHGRVVLVTMVLLNLI